jgi:hypothetical protein
MEEWISFGRALELILERTGSSIGRAENIRRQALASDEVRFRHSAPVTEETSRPVRREAGLVIVIGGRTERDELNYDDLLDWLDRNHPKPAPAPKAPLTDASPTAPKDRFMKSGAAGQPTSKHLIEGELDRRIAALKPGEFLGRDIKDVGEKLSKWLEEDYPRAHPDSPRPPPYSTKAVQNNTELTSKIRPHVPTPKTKDQSRN